VYESEDGRDITVAAGIVESIEQTADADTEEEEEPSSDIKALRKLVEDQNKTIADLQAKFNKAVPPTPRPVARGNQAPDAKTPKPKAKAEHHSTL